jgi:hypothetical protein
VSISRGKEISQPPMSDYSSYMEGVVLRDEIEIHKNAVAQYIFFIISYMADNMFNTHAIFRSSNT